MTLSKATSKPIDQGRIDPSSPLAEVIENLYKHLDFPAPSDLGVCDCCVSARTTKNILSKKQRELSREEIWEWFQGAAIDDFPQEVWGFLLPRIAEIISCGLDVYGIGLEISLCRFQTGNPDFWSEKQWTAIDAFQKAYLKNFRIVYDDFSCDILCMFVSAGWPLKGLSDQLLSWDDHDLLEFFWRNGPSTFGIPEQWDSTFWPDGTGIRPLLKSEELSARMECMVFDENLPSEIQHKASIVYDTLRAF